MTSHNIIPSVSMGLTYGISEGYGLTFVWDLLVLVMELVDAQSPSVYGLSHKHGLQDVIDFPEVN